MSGQGLPVVSPLLHVEGGPALLPLLVVPAAFYGAVGIFLVGDWYARSRSVALTPGMATAIAGTTALLATLGTRPILLAKVWDIGAVTLGAGLCYPLGVAVERREEAWSVALVGAVVALSWGISLAFPDTAGTVVPLTLAAGVAFFLVGYWLSNRADP